MDLPERKPEKISREDKPVEFKMRPAAVHYRVESPRAALVLCPTQKDGYKNDMIDDLRTFYQWDVENWSCAHFFWLKNTRCDFMSSLALEIGSGCSLQIDNYSGGGLSLFLALKGTHVICTDIKAPKQKTKWLHNGRDLSKMFSYAVLDGRTIPFKESTFDLVVFKSVLGALQQYDDQKRMIDEIHRVLKPNGELWFAENLTGSFLHTWARKIFTGGRWRYINLNEINDLCSPFKDLLVKPYGVLGAFGRREWQRRLLGKIDGILDPILPDSLKYISFVIARKGSGTS